MEPTDRLDQKVMQTLSVIASDTFLVSLFLYLAAVRIDVSLQGLVSAAIPLNIFLLIAVVSGLATVVLPPHEVRSVQKPPKRLWMYVVLISVFVGSIVTEILNGLSPWALLIGVAAAFVVFLVSFAIIRQE